MVIAALNTKIKYFVSLCFVLCLLLMATMTWAADDSETELNPDSVSYAASVQATGAEDEGWKDENWEDEWDAPAELADPLEPVNRLFFRFNDRLYYWVLKPVARVYADIIPEELRIGFRNFFDNLRSPARAVSSLIQGNLRNCFTDVARFALNSTVGILGMGDFANDVLDMPSSQEDLGQAFARYGAGGGFYIVWPFLGPSNLRDSVGLVGDSYLHPIILLDVETEVIIGVWTFDKINYTSLTLGDYELFTQTALDPYVAVKDAYLQFRTGLIENK